MLNDFLAQDGLSESILEQLSCFSELSLSLKRNLRYFSYEALEKEYYRLDRIYHTDNTKVDILKELKIAYRIKSFESWHAKWEKYHSTFPHVRLEKVFNDILGLMTFCNSYLEIQNLNFQNSHMRMVDLTNGKSQDDGYRGIHLYFQISHQYFPIEIQYHTHEDAKFNQWLHIYVYKQKYPKLVGKKMREAYDQKEIHDIIQFKEVLHHVLSDCQRPL